MPKHEQKQVIIDEIKSKLNNAVSIVLVDSRGLKVSEDTDLRRKLREANVTYKVYKNNLVSRAVEGTNFAGLDKYLAGPTAMAICYDEPTKAASIISKMSKTYKALEFKAGVVENIVYDAKGIIAIADIPSREELLSKLLGSMKAPMSSFARVIKEAAQKQAQ